MKRPHSIAFLVSSVLCSSKTITPTFATFDTEIIDPRKKDDTYKLEPCFTLLTHATKYDFDESGGLSKVEFETYFNSLDGSSSSSSFSTSSLSDTSTNLYSELLCECHYTYDYPISCCDDTNTADDDLVEAEDGKNTPGLQDDFGTWDEISLLGITDAALGDKPGGKEKKYITKFCNGIENAMEAEDIELGIDEDEPVVAPITTTTTTTVAATEEASATNGTDAPLATTADPEITSVPTDSVSTEATSTTTDGSTTTTATAATTTVDTDPTIQTRDPIVLSFVGSTGGKADATTVNMDDVTNAVWKVGLDVLNELQESARRLSVVGGVTLMHSKHKDGVEMEKKERQLDSWDFGEEAAVYFESVTMVVEDVGTQIQYCTVSFASKVHTKRSLTVLFIHLSHVMFHLECPDGLDYASPSDPCIEFTYTLLPLPNGPLTPELASEFTTSFDSAVNDDGKLYDALVSEYQETDIIGLGSPGKGIPLDDSEAANAAQMEMVQLERDSANQTDVQSSGLSVGGIVGIAMAAVLVALLIAAVIVKKRRRSKQQSLDDSNLSEDIEADEVNADAAHVEEWLDEEDESGNGRNRTRDGMKTSPGSSLAALGVASTVATRLSTGDTEIMFTQKQAWSKDEPVV